MNQINITEDKINKLEDLPITGFNSGGYLKIKDEETIYKFYYKDSFYTPTREKNIDHLLKYEPISETGYPITKIYVNNIFSGFSMPYFQNAKTLSLTVKSNRLSIDEKIDTISNMYKQLKALHNRKAVLGDIHMDNIIVNGNTHIIDLDDIRLNGNTLLFNKYYAIKKDSKSKEVFAENPKTDNIKFLIASLSLIYGINLEKFMLKHNLQDFNNIIKDFVPDSVRDYLDYTFKMNMPVVYFDTIVNDFYGTKNIRKSRNLIKESIKNKRKS